MFHFEFGVQDEERVDRFDGGGLRLVRLNR
jgi:hypothetical protein